MSKETPLDQSVEACVEECEMVMYPTVQSALESAGIKPTEVGLLETSHLGNIFGWILSFC
jgi:hypothetical protein